MRKIATLLFFISFISACSLLDKEEEIPALIEIESISLKTDLTTQGAPTHKITDAWIFVDDNSAGTYEMPFKIPVLEVGNRKLSIQAGIKNNGISLSRRAYPFYKTKIFENYDLERGKTHKLDVEVSYHDNLKFLFIEDFEDVVTQFEKIPQANTDIERVLVTDDIEKFGQYVGYIKLDASKNINFFAGNTKEKYRLPKLFQPVYLELDFKTDKELVVGLISHYPDGRSFADPVITLNPTFDKETNGLFWNKIYIDFTQFINGDNAIDFQVTFTTDLSNNAGEANVYIDNIKLIHQ